MAALIPLVGPVFEWAGHEPALREHEVTYARILMLGAFPTILMATLSSFFAGRGQTLAVLRVNILATVVNATLDYLWIFGHGGFPRMGVSGAAWSTVISQVVGALAFLAIILRRDYRERYRTLAGWRFESALFGRLLRFGLPTGLQYSLEILAFALFMILVGRIGTDELAACGIAFNLNMIVFMPMMGLGLGVSSLVGRHLGGEDPARAERTVRSAFLISLVYMSACGLLYVFGSGVLLAPYAAGSDPRAFAGIARMAPVLLRFVALYSIFDMMNVIFAAGLKGAGDTVYPLMLTVMLSWGAMLVPAYFACLVQGGGVYVAWCFATPTWSFSGSSCGAGSVRGDGSRCAWSSRRALNSRDGRLSLRSMPRNLEPYDSILEAIGWTPLVRLHRVTRGIRTPVFGKAENLNPGGSVKDRIGLAIIEAAEKSGALKPGGVVVEATSGNTGVGLAIAAAIKGYRCIFTIPDKMSTEKVRLLRAYGAEVIVVPTAVPPDHPEYYITQGASRSWPPLPGRSWPTSTTTPPTRRPTTSRQAPRSGSRRKGRSRTSSARRAPEGTISGSGPLPQGEEPEGLHRGRRPRGLDLHGVREDAREGPGLSLQGRGDRGRQDPDVPPLRRDRRVDDGLRRRCRSESRGA